MGRPFSFTFVLQYKHMRHRWAPAFTIIELVIVVTVLGILIGIVAISYSGFREEALATAAQNDLNTVISTMERELQQNNTFPSSFPADLRTSEGVSLTLIEVGETPFYTNLSTVQNGVLLSQICDDLIDEGKGNGFSQAGDIRDYITGCDQWNHDSMQITGWHTEQWDIPVQKQTLIDYGTDFTTNSTWDIDEERVTEEFYLELVSRFEAQGGTFPIESFWDDWANSGNGGVILQPLDTNPITKKHYCAEARVVDTALVWHVTQTKKIEEGGC